MTHQVNLNSKQLLPGYGPVQLPLFAAVLALTLLGCGVWVFSVWFERNQLIQEQERLSLELAQEQRELADFQARYPNLNNEATLLAQQQQLQAQLQQVRDTYKGLAHQVENAITGFHQPLTQLSNVDIQGLWLEQIKLQDGKRLFALKGMARDPELVPLYLQQLGASSFAGISVDQLSVVKEEKSPLWRFSLANQAAKTTRQTTDTEEAR